jgi:hypothetical protein
VNLDIFWLRDESQDDGASLDDPDVIALEMVEDLRAVLEELEAIAADLAPAEDLATRSRIPPSARASVKYPFDLALSRFCAGLDVSRLLTCDKNGRLEWYPDHRRDYLTDVLGTPALHKTTHEADESGAGLFIIFGLNMNGDMKYAVRMSGGPASEAARLLASLRRREIRSCEVCGTEVVGTVRRQYCSQQCSLKADYLRHAEARRAKRRARYQQQKEQGQHDQA